MVSVPFSAVAKRFSSLAKHPDWLCEPPLSSPSLLLNEHKLSPPPPGVEQPASDADHSAPSSEDAKNERSYTSIPPIYLHGVERDSSIFTFYLLAVKIQIASLNTLHANKQNG